MTQDFNQNAAAGLNIQELQARGVNATWIGKLTEIHNAGVQGFLYGIVKTAQPLQFLTKFCILAFFFNWIYYLLKGMWKKGLVFIGAYIAVGMIGGILSVIALPLGLLVYVVGYIGVPVYAALSAPGDYYRYAVLKEDFWI